MNFQIEKNPQKVLDDLMSWKAKALPPKKRAHLVLGPGDPQNKVPSRVQNSKVAVFFGINKTSSSLEAHHGWSDGYLGWDWNFDNLRNLLIFVAHTFFEQEMRQNALMYP